MLCVVVSRFASEGKIVILADCPGTREAHFNTGSRPDSRIPGYPSTRCEPYTLATKLLDESTHMDQVLSLSLLEGLNERYKLIICLQYWTVMERALSLLKLLERQ